MSFPFEDIDGSLAGGYAFFDVAETYELDLGEALADIVDGQLGLLDEEYAQAGSIPSGGG